MERTPEFCLMRKEHPMKMKKTAVPVFIPAAHRPAAAHRRPGGGGE